MVRAAPPRVRRGVFGRDPSAYDEARLGYPSVLWETLERRCGLRPGAAVFEIGPGTGKATRELLRRGADPMTLIEADPRLVGYLRRHLGTGTASVTIRQGRFEKVELPEGAFDLGVAASSFHWLPPVRSLRRIADALRPGGWWAYWIHLHGDPWRPSAFQRAVRPVYQRTFGGGRSAARSRALSLAERDRRLATLRKVGRFDRIRCTSFRWTATLPTERVVAIFASFSDIATLRAPARRRFLEDLEGVLTGTFGATVGLPMRTPLYTARRCR